MSQFSKKDYIWLAEAWRRLIDAQPLATDRLVLDESLELFANLLGETSPNFKKDLFLSKAKEPIQLPARPNTQPKGHCNG